MVLSVSSHAAVVFLAAIGQGHGLKPSARIAGINEEVGYRFLRARYLELRQGGLSAAATIDAIGFTSSRVPDWESAVARDDGRHHLQVELTRETAFWVAFDAGGKLPDAVAIAGVSRSTGYRWLQRRFNQLRDAGLGVKRCAHRLRLTARNTTQRPSVDRG